MDPRKPGRKRQDTCRRCNRNCLFCNGVYGVLRFSISVGCNMAKITDFCIKFTIGGLVIIGFIALSGLAAIIDG